VFPLAMTQSEDESPVTPVRAFFMAAADASSQPLSVSAPAAPAKRPPLGSLARVPWSLGPDPRSLGPWVTAPLGAWVFGAGLGVLGCPESGPWVLGPHGSLGRGLGPWVPWVRAVGPWVLGHRVSGSLGPWVRAVGVWVLGALGPGLGSLGLILGLGPWMAGPLDTGPGPLGPWVRASGPSGPESLAPWVLGSLGSWAPGSLGPWVPGAGPCFPGSLGPRALGPWAPGCPGSRPWVPGFLDSSVSGSWVLVSWVPGFGF
jgi:hypothetical protein